MGIQSHRRDVKCRKEHQDSQHLYSAECLSLSILVFVGPIGPALIDMFCVLLVAVLQQRQTDSYDMQAETADTPLEFGNSTLVDTAVTFLNDPKVILVFSILFGIKRNILQVSSFSNKECAEFLRFVKCPSFYRMLRWLCLVLPVVSASQCHSY